MAKYSRVSKYEDLRNRLQNDTDTKIESKDLSRFEKKLNEINANNFEAPRENTSYDEENYDPIHARRRQYLDNTSYENTTKVKEEPQEVNKPINYERNDYSSYNNNEYLNDYIREVKKYNMEQGNAYSTNTDLNVLHSIKKDEPPVVPSKPYVQEEKHNSNPFYSYRDDDEDTTSIPKMNSNSNSSKQDSYTSDIPTFKSSKRTFEEFMDDDNDELDTSTMTKEDIAAEVQSLIRGQELDNTNRTNINATSQKQKKNQNDTLDYHFEAERNARQQLLNETTQMRAQLDNYEDNLSEVSSKMQHTDRMVSNVLIVLIIVLIVVLLVVVYWILNANGIL